WDAVWSNFRPAVGNTLADFYLLLHNDAIQLARVGDFTNQVHELLRFELEKAADDLPALPTVGAVDLSLEAQGFPLIYGRTFGASIFDRFRLGRLGRGWTDDYDMAVTTDSHNVVTIRQGNVLRFFGKLADGTYVAFPGETASLTASGTGL